MANDYESFSDHEKDEICRFANSLTPKNWIVCLSRDNCVRKATYLNILLDIGIWNPSLPLGYNGIALLPRYEDGVGYSTVQLQPVKKKKWKSVLIHELAHVVVFRWVARRTGLYRYPRASLVSLRVFTEGCFAASMEKAGDMELMPVNDELASDALLHVHGAVFKAALSLMRNRAKKCNSPDRVRRVKVRGFQWV